MDSKTYSPLSDACAKLLTDKMYEKRKLAALEIEKMVAEFAMAKNYGQVEKLISVISREFANSPDSNKRKGGLIGLAGISIGLGKDTEKFIKELVNPILNCLNDTDTRVRYFASESLYNVVKVARSSIISMFPKIFPTLSQLVTDPDQQVKSGSELLDRLLKDIITENSQTFDLHSFIPLLRERLLSKNSFSRQFIISWISVLNAVPEINLLVYLPEFLDGLFQMLEDNMVEIQRMCDTVLGQFLKAIRKDPSSANIPDMTNIVIGHANSNIELIQYTSMKWLREFVNLSGPNMLKYASGIFSAILPCLAYDSEHKRHIKECAQEINKKLLTLISSKDENSDASDSLKELDLDSVMEVLRQYLSTQSSVPTKVAVLKWIHFLFTEINDEMSIYSNDLFPVLLGILSDASDDVVLQGIIVLAEIVNSTKNKGSDFNQAQYRNFLVNLLNLFSGDKVFLEKRGSLIIRQLCVLLNAEYIYVTLADIISTEIKNFKFASTIVRTLNIILLTTTELFDLRNSLRDIKNKNSAELFVRLYKCWAHCPVSTLALTLLAQCYEHVSDLVVIFGDLEMTVDVLVEIDKLIQLIESPIFASLRLKLVSRENDCVEAQHLAQALFGILMLLPQTDAFILLKNRLQCVPNWGSERGPKTKPSIENQSGIDFPALLVHFKKIQDMHRENKLMQRKKNMLMVT